MKIISIVLSGGGVVRKWSASRRAHPKQIMTLGAGGLLDQALSSRQACGADQVLCSQYHHQRAEHRVLVIGHGVVQIGDEDNPTQPGQYWYIPLSEKHRLTNTASAELVSMDVQYGEYLGEDHVVGFADGYGRAG